MPYPIYRSTYLYVYPFPKPRLGLDALHVLGADLGEDGKHLDSAKIKATQSTIVRAMGTWTRVLHHGHINTWTCSVTDLEVSFAKSSCPFTWNSESPRPNFAELPWTFFPKNPVLAPTGRPSVVVFRNEGGAVVAAAATAATASEEKEGG